MDLNASAQNVANEKNSKKRRAVEDGDIISHLPQSIIGHILSFLPTNEAVRTCVLSTKWINMWTFITSLYFSDFSCANDGGKGKKCFLNFIDRVLQYTQPNIQSFTLICVKSYDSRSVNKLISSILRRQVQKLHIYYHENICVSSHSLLNCNSLVHLQLETICTLTVPTFICLPNLQILILSQISFQSDSSDPHSEEVTLSFPVLKVFESIFCKWINVQCVSFETPLLESFAITCHKFKFKPRKSLECAIKISTSHLKKFYVYGNLLEDITLLESPSPFDASINISRGRTMPLDELFPRTCTLLKRFHEVEKLKLGNLTMMVLDYEANLYESLPTFEMLVSLEIHLFNCDAETVLNLLHKSPNLKTLVCEKAPRGFHVNYPTSAIVPYCFFFSLKMVEFKEFDWFAHDACFMRFVMETTQVLEQVKIHLTNKYMYYSKKQIDRIKEEVLSFEKGSSCASVSVDVHH